MSRRRSDLCLALLALLLGCAPAGWAQVQNFCELKEIRVEPVSNGMIIHLKADGLLNFTLGDWDLWAPDPDGRWYLKPVTRVTLRLNNVRVGASSIHEVGVYPVSHLAFSMPPGSRDSVGLICTLVLLRPAYLTYLQIPDGNWDGTANSRYAGPQVMVMRTQSQDEAMIIVTSDRLYHPPPEHYGGENSALSVTGTADRLSVQATNADLHVVAETVSILTGEPIFVDDRAQRYVSACLADLPLDRALRALAAGYGLALSRREGSYYLTNAFPDDAAAYYAGEQRRIPLRYLPAGDAPDLLAPPLLRNVYPETGTNSVLVTGPPALLDKVERDLAVLDQPSSHCRLRAWIISAARENQSLRKVLGRFSGGTTRAEISGGKNLQVLVAPDAPSSILAELRALATREQIRMVALPFLEVENGEQAELFVGQRQYYFRLVGRRTQALTLDFVPAGSRLLIEPRASGEAITAHLIAENSALLPPTSLGPRLKRTTVDSHIRLGDGRCVLIGGLTLSGADDQADRPGIGRPLTALFDETRKSGEVSEVWVLVEGRARLATTPPPVGPTEDKPS